MTKLPPSTYQQLRVMRNQAEIGLPLQPGNGAISLALIRHGIIQAFLANSRKRFEFTPYGWLVACREELWREPKKRHLDVHATALRGFR